MKKILSIIGLRILPAVIVVVILLRLCAAFLIEIHPLAHLVVSVFAIVGAIWMAGGSLFRELNEYAEYRASQRRKRMHEE